MRSQLIPAEAWAAACEVVGGRPITPFDPMEHWESVGWLDADGSFDQRVSSLIGTHLRAPIVFSVTSTFGNLQALTQVSVCGNGLITSHTARFRFDTDPTGQAQITGADPDIEFVVEKGTDPWPLIARTLPPLKILLAPPEQTPEELVERVELDSSDRARFGQAASQPGDDSPTRMNQLLAQAGITLPEIRASVALTVVVHPAGDAVAVGGRVWLASSQLFRVLTLADGPALEKVQPGDLGFGVTWLALGAREHLRMRADS